jgi:competence protein ComGC
MKNINTANTVAPKSSAQTRRLGFLSDQRGVGIFEIVIVIAIIVVLAIIVVPNANLFLGVDKKINAANLEAANVRTAAVAYEINHQGKYPADSDVLLNAGNYITIPRAYYIFDAGTGRITSATMDTIEHIPANPWTGISWNNTTDTWGK